MTCAYYSRNQSYSRSYNAEIAESEGRLPRNRAAKYLGISLKAFDAGCENAEYVATEWHHVGKYANCVYYYDCEELQDSELFWKGVINSYKSILKQKELQEKLKEVIAKKRQEIRIQLRSQWLKYIPPKRHYSFGNWQKYVRKCLQDAGFVYSGLYQSLPSINKGDMEGIKNKIQALQEKRDSPWTNEKWEKYIRRRCSDTGVCYRRNQNVPLIPMGDEDSLDQLISERLTRKAA
jgi:hypothetical protein